MMQEYWESYMKPIDGHAASVSFNEEISLEELPFMGFVKVLIHDPKENGMLSSDEQTQIIALEDRLELEALRYKVGKYAGRIITQGSVNFIYYLKYDFEWSMVVSDTMNHFSDYKFEFGSRMDSEGEVYKKLLYPTLKEWQIIHNHLTCKQLSQAGDNLRLKRAIEHKVYFKEPEQREVYKEFIQSEGFKIQKELQPTEENELHGLQFYRIDVPYYYDIDTLTLWLIECVEAHSGEYDGWETSIVKV